jgi:SAM-dependent methyltransferase
MDLQGQALWDYFREPEKEIMLKLHTSYGAPEQMPAEVFFREYEDFTFLERNALAACRGKVLDVGAGAGAFALELQERGHEVSALELSPLSCQIMRQRGVREVVEGNLWTYAGPTYDTILLMMNGLGLAGTLEQIPRLLTHLAKSLKPGGQILADTSDIAYLYAGKNKPVEGYYGEVRFRYEYKRQLGDWFPWVYADPKALQALLSASGWQAKELYSEQEQYLFRLQPNI